MVQVLLSSGRELIADPAPVHLGVVEHIIELLVTQFGAGLGSEKRYDTLAHTNESNVITNKTIKGVWGFTHYQTENADSEKVTTIILKEC